MLNPLVIFSKYKLFLYLLETIILFMNLNKTYYDNKNPKFLTIIATCILLISTKASAEEIGYVKVDRSDAFGYFLEKEMERAELKNLCFNKGNKTACKSLNKSNSKFN